MSGLPVLQQRACGDCVACCVVFDIDEPGLAPVGDEPKRAGDACRHLNHGCTVYDKRPSACRDFECLWMRGVGDDGDRPDVVGFVLHEMAPAEGDTFGPIVVATEARAGALEDDAPGYAVASLIGMQVRVIVNRASGRRGIMPVRMFKPEELPEELRGSDVATIPMNEPQR